MGGSTWTSNAAFTTNGSQVVVNAGGPGLSAFLSFTFQPGLVYDLSANLSPTTSLDANDDWLALGFGDFSNPNKFHAGGNSVTPWVLSKTSGSVVAVVNDAATLVPTPSSTTATGPTNYDIILDTTGSQWKVDWLYNHISFTTYTYPLGQNPTTISGVGIGAYLEDGFIDNVQLTTIPEPSTFLLLAIGLAAYSLRRCNRS